MASSLWETVRWALMAMKASLCQQEAGSAATPRDDGRRKIEGLRHARGRPELNKTALRRWARTVYR